jgi:hypothetical protein
MLNLTRRSKNNKSHKKNKTIRKGGGYYDKGDGDNKGEYHETIQSGDEKTGGDDEGNGDHKKRQGVISMLGNTITGIAASAGTALTDTALRIAGLERIKSQEEEQRQGEQEPLTSSTISGVQNIVDKTGATVLGSVNNVIESDASKQTTLQAAQNTAEIVKMAAKAFNDALDNPVVKAEVEKAVENAGEIGTLLIEAAEKPVNKMIDLIAVKSIPKAINAVLTGMVKAGTSAASALPGVGALVSLLKIIDDSSRATSAVVEAGSEAVEAASDAFIETTENVYRLLNELDEKNKMAEQISNRTTNSINEFENPIIQQPQSKEGRRTRRKFFRNKGKSKRVRFAF